MSDLFAARQSADAAWADRAIARIPQITSVAALWTAVDAMTVHRASMDKSSSARISTALRGQYEHLTGRTLEGLPAAQEEAA